MAEAESISLEETNKIRVSLGLKPLTADSPPRNNQDEEAEKNYAARREQERKDADAQRIKDKIDKARNKREYHRRLQGTTLGDADADVDDTLKWLKSSKRREKELAEKRRIELESRDEGFQGEDYTEKDLAGLKVSHDLDAIEEGQDRILTLKDSRILDNEEDELHDVEMAEDEKDQKRHELKTKRKDYKGYDDDEFVAGGEGRKKNLLSKYDEEIDGTPETGFRLGGPSRPSKSQLRKVQEEEAVGVNKTLLSIDYIKNVEISDYMKEGDVGFKKPKTKKKRSTRKVEADPDLLPMPSADGASADQDHMDVDEKPAIPKPRVRDLDANFVDDDELQAALARSRRSKTMKTVKVTPEDLARRMLEEKREVSVQPAEAEPPAAVEEEGLTFDDTSEFIRNISNRPVVVTIKTRPERTPEGEEKPAAERGTSELKDDPMDGDEAVSELEAGEVDEDNIKEEEMDDEQMLMAIEEAISHAETDLRDDAVNKEIGITEEPLAGGRGMASALQLLRQQGLVAKANPEAQEREKTQREKDAWLASHRHRLAQRELDRLKSRGANKDQAQREYENRLRDQADARESADLFKNYKPDVNIVYYDEFGRALTPKEAWKALSHRFHGKGSGRAKMEKRLKKIAEEKKQEAMASGDTPLGMNDAFQTRQERVGQAHMVLSVGQRGAVPQVVDLLDNQTLSKKVREKGKKKGPTTTTQRRSASAAVETPALVSLLAPPALLVASAMTSAEPSPSPAPDSRHMRPAFARVSMETSQPAPGSGGATPLNGGDRTKVTFGLKRKAMDEGESTPSTKRR